MAANSNFIIVPGPNDELAASVNEALAPIRASSPGSVSPASAASPSSRHSSAPAVGDPTSPTLSANEAPADPSQPTNLSSTGVLSPGGQPMILTPSRLKIDSRVLIAHTTSSWLLNAVFASLILVKLGGPEQDLSWWLVFSPTFFSHLCAYFIQITTLLATVGLAPTWASLHRAMSSTGMRGLRSGCDT